MNRLRLAAYALPSIPLAALTLPLYIIVPTFYTETLGLPLAAVGLALVLVRVFDGFNDPAIGWLSDRFRPPWGRRRSLFALGLPVCALAAYKLFAPPVGADAVYLGVWGLVLTLGYTLTLLPYIAWGAELETSYDGRSTVVGWRESFTLTGTLIAIALPFLVGLESAQGWHGLAVLGAGVAATLLVFGAVTVFIVPEPREHSRQRVKLWAGLRLMAGNTAFLRLIAAYFLNGLANGIPATLFLYFVSDRLGLPDWRGPLLMAYFLAGIAGVPLALHLARRWGKHTAWCRAMMVACGVFLLVPLIPPGAGWLFLAICLGTGLFLGFDLTIPASIQADVVDLDTACSGEQRTGLYFAAWSLSTKLSLALGVGIVFPLLDLVGFVPGQAAQGGETLFLAALYAWLPVVFKALAIALMWHFPIAREVQASLRAEIDADHPSTRH